MTTFGELKLGALRQGSLPGDHKADDSWLVGPCGRSRESDLIEESNFAVAVSRLSMIDSDKADYEVIRFGHFAVGWIDEIVTRPGSACAAAASKMRESLEDYPILDEDHYSYLEQEYESSNWSSILSDLRRQVVQTFKRRGADDSWIEYTQDLGDNELDEIQRAVTDGGESSDGWRKWSDRDADKIADEIVGRDAETDALVDHMISTTNPNETK